MRKMTALKQDEQNLSEGSSKTVNELNDVVVSKGQSNDAITLTYPVRPAHFSVVKKTFSNESAGLILFVYPEGLKFKMILNLLQRSVWDLQIIHTKRY